MSLRNDLNKLAWSLVTAALLGLCGWVYTTGNRVTALEEREKSISQKLDDIGMDVRQIRNWIIPQYDNSGRH